MIRSLLRKVPPPHTEGPQRNRGAINWRRVFTVLALIALSLSACLKATTTPTSTPSGSPATGETATATAKSSPTPKSSPTATPTPVSLYATYDNTDEGFSLSYPRDWLESEPGGLTPILIITAPGQLPQA